MMLDAILENLKVLGDEASYINSEGMTTFSELYGYVSNFYHFLLRENEKRLPVVIIGHKEVYFRAAMVASSFAGMVYVPIDRHTPRGRILEILEQLGEVFVIGGSFSSQRCVSVSEINDAMRCVSERGIGRIYMGKDDAYYIIFTSGSTGKPKGVIVSYKNVDSCVRWLASLIDVRGKVIANQGDFSFDLSVADLYVSLFCGATHLAYEKDCDEGAVDRIVRCLPSYAVFTPSFVDLLLLDKRFSAEGVPSLEGIIFCGERLRSITVRRLRERFPMIELINCYGPTEATFAVTGGIVKGEEITLGTAKDGVEVVIADKQMAVLPDGEVGEIVIIGDSVADGYLSGESGGFFEYIGRKAYRTGDLGRMVGGELFFSGRADGQIKYKGYRIELEDIERNLSELGFVEFVMVYAKRDEEGRVLKICADVLLKNGEDISARDIKAKLSDRLPSYMIPMIRVVDEIPLSANGKYMIGADNNGEKTYY